MRYFHHTFVDAFIAVHDDTDASIRREDLVWFGLVWLYGIPTIVDYLMPNPFFYI